MGLMLNFFRAYPWQTTLLLISLLLSGVAEGIGLSALLPLLNIALGSDASSMVPGANMVEQSDFIQSPIPKSCSFRIGSKPERARLRARNRPGVR